MYIKKNGFMLMEVMIAIGIIGAVLTPIVILQGRIVRRVFNLSAQMNQIIFAQNFFIDVHQKMEPDVREFNVESTGNLGQDSKKIGQDSNTVLKYTLGSVDKKSSVGSIPGLLVERVQIISKNNLLPPYSLISFVFKPEYKKI